MWPELPFDHWRDTCDTLHMWTQIVGKTRMELAPLVNHYWNVTLYVTPRGLTTSSIPFRDLAFDVEFDFQRHRLVISTSERESREMALQPRSVASFYSEYMECLRSLGIEVKIHTMPAEFADPIPFDKDEKHASYDKQSVERFHQKLIASSRVLNQFRARFIGKCSPVHFFWGSFDLAVSRFNGRRAPQKPDADPITREAYSHEVISCGFWPGDTRFPQAAFYSYTAPAPAGLEQERIRPQAAYWDTTLGEFILKYDDARRAASPDDALMQFCESTYEAGAKLANWDRAALER